MVVVPGTGRNSGRVNMNIAAATSAHERGIEAFTLLWDPDRHIIGLKPGPKDNPKNHTLIYDKKKHSFAALSLGGFFRWIGWEVKERLVLPLEWNAKAKIFQVTVPKGEIETPTQHPGAAKWGAFEIFEHKLKRALFPALTMMPKHYKIIVNAEAIRIFRKERVEAVEVLWDPTPRRIALKAAPKGSEDSFIVSTDPSLPSRTGMVTVKGFFEFIGWGTRKSVFLPGQWDPQTRSIEAIVPEEHLKAKAERSRQ